MGNPDLTILENRVRLIEEIKSEENISRKREMQKRFDVYFDRQDRYIEEKLLNEFSAKTVQEMRKVLSVNISKKIINDSASLYSEAPEREFENASEAEEEHIEALYDNIRINVANKRSNRYLKLQHQNIMMIVPDRKGGLKMRPVPMQQLDVIPDAEHPEEAYAYILNAWDVDNRGSYAVNNPGNISQTENDYFQNDRMNQGIADDNDREAEQERYVIWTPEIHFTMDGKGNFVTDLKPNPIAPMLPFVDVADEKDFQFYVRRGQNITEFAIDFSLILSDLSNISRLQGYSQAVIVSEKLPTNMRVGPNHILHLKPNPKAPEIKPEFSFVSPSPDMAGSLSLLEATINFLLSAEGQDTSSVTSGQTRQYSSGIDRALALLDRFQASSEDADLFKDVEQKEFDIIRAWNNVLQGTDGLNPDIKGPQLNDRIKVRVKYAPPKAFSSKAEVEASVKNRLEMGMMSEAEAIAELREVSVEQAEFILAQIADSQMNQITPIKPEPRSEEDKFDQELEDEPNDGSTKDKQKEGKSDDKFKG